MLNGLDVVRARYGKRNSLWFRVSYLSSVWWSLLSHKRKLRTTSRVLTNHKAEGTARGEQNGRCICLGAHGGNAASEEDSPDTRRGWVPLLSPQQAEPSVVT